MGIMIRQKNHSVNSNEEKVALILRGLSYRKSYRHQSGFSYKVDYRKCFKNHQANLPLTTSDVYFSTNQHELADDVIKKYHPVSYVFDSKCIKARSVYQSVAHHIRQCFSLIRASGKKYDTIIISRFDIFLEYSLENLAIDTSKFNFICYAENNDLIDDNLWIFPSAMMEEIDAILTKIEEGSIEKTHELIKYLDKKDTHALFKGNFFIMKERPYIKFLREVGFLSSMRRLKIRLIHSKFCWHPGMPVRRFILNATREILRMPRREIAWRLYAIKALGEKLAGKNTASEQVHFITFYTQGQPHDDGLDLTRSCVKLLRAVRPFVDSVKSFSAQQLRSNPATEIYVKEFPEEAKYNFRTNKIGFLRWKPYIILETLKKAKDGDIVIYRDCNIKKYPNILYKVYEIRVCAKEVLRLLGQDVFVPIENFPHLKIKHNVKRQVLETLGILSEESMERYLHNASIIICRKSPQSIKMMEEWLAFCMDDDLLSPLAPSYQHCDFLHNTQEQAILNGVLAKHAPKQKNWNSPLGLSVIDRAFSMQKIVKVPRVAILYCGQLRNFDNKDLIFHNCRNLLGLYNCDVFASCWETRGYSFYHGHATETDYAARADVSAEKLAELCRLSNAQLRSVEFEEFDPWLATQPEVMQKLYHEGMPINDKKVLATSFPQLYKIERANLLKKAFEEKHGFKYDVVIRFRPDMCLVEEIPAFYFRQAASLYPQEQNIYHLNPPKIYYPYRIYDIFFFGSSAAMDGVCSAWSNIMDLVSDDFDNKLPKVDACRLLYIQALRHNLNVVDIPRCIGDIYRDEPMEKYFDKILHQFN